MSRWWGPGRAGMWRPSGAPSWACRSAPARTTGPGASASTGDVSPPRRCCATRRWWGFSPERQSSGSSSRASRPTMPRRSGGAARSPIGWPRGSNSSSGRTRSPSTPGADGSRARRWWRSLPRAGRLERAPKSLIIIGAGAVGMEFADVYATYGVQVTLLEALPRVLPMEDEEVSAQLARLFPRRGIGVRTGVKVGSVKATKSGVTVEVEAEGKAERLQAGQVLMAAGRSAKVKDLGLEALGVALERGFAKVSPRMETSVKGLYAIGDMAGQPVLAPKAMAAGVVPAQAIPAA